MYTSLTVHYIIFATFLWFPFQTKNSIESQEADTVGLDATFLRLCIKYVVVANASGRLRGRTIMYLITVASQCAGHGEHTTCIQMFTLNPHAPFVTTWILRTGHMTLLFAALSQCGVSLCRVVQCGVSQCGVSKCGVIHVVHRTCRYLDSNVNGKYLYIFAFFLHVRLGSDVRFCIFGNTCAEMSYFKLF